MYPVHIDDAVGASTPCDLPDADSGVSIALLPADAGRGTCLTLIRRRDHAWYCAGLFRDGRRCRRRRSRRYCDPLRLLPLSGGYHDRYGHPAGCACHDPAAFGIKDRTGSG